MPAIFFFFFAIWSYQEIGQIHSLKLIIILYIYIWPGGVIVFQFKENLSFTTVITQISIVPLTEFSTDFSVRRWYKRFPGSLTNNNTYFPFFSFFLTKDMKSLVFNVYFLFSYFISALFKIMKIKERYIGCRKGAGLVRGGAYSSNTVLR